MPDPLFENLLRQTVHLRWSSPAEVVRQGRRRRRRQVVVTGAVTAVLVLATAGGVIAGTTQRSSSPPSTNTATGAPAPSVSPTIASPAPTSAAPTSAPPSTTPSSRTPSEPPRSSAAAGPAIPAAALLTVSDLAPGFRVVRPDEPGDGAIAFLSTSCQNSSFPNLRRLAQRDRFFVRGSQDQAELVHQTVQRYPGSLAAEYLDQLRSWVLACEPERPGVRVSVIDDGFAGDGSVLVESDIEGVRSMWAVVRQGDLVTEINRRPADRAELLRLADRAAQRLCVATGC